MILLLNFRNKRVLRPKKNAKSCPIQGNSRRLKKLEHSTLLATVLAILLQGTSFSSFANGESRPIGHSDQLFLDNQQVLAETVVYDALLTRLNGQKDHDIALLQRVIDKKALRKEQTKELQSLGVALGNLLAKEYRLPWVIFTDEKGRSRGLEVDNSTQVLFPLTMISRRVEAGASANVAEIYAKAERIIRYTRANRPLFSK